MTRLLMLDTDQRLVSAVTRALSREGVRVTGAESVEEARALVAVTPFDAALLDCDMFDHEQLSAFAALRVLFTTSFMESDAAHHIVGGARLLRKPFTSAQLLSALHETCGTLEPQRMTLMDLLSRAHGEKRSFALRIGDAEIFMERGELVHAALAELTGEAALVEVLADTQRELIVIPSRLVTRTIHRSFQALVLDLLRLLEEREQWAGVHVPEREDTAGGCEDARPSNMRQLERRKS